MITIILNEWKLLLRDRRAIWLSLTIIALAFTSFAFQYGETSALLSQREDAQRKSRMAWLRQGEKHPHIAAHFGNYAYKIPSALSIIDPGLTSYMGSSVYLEPHRQNDFLLSAATERDSGSRFGWFTPAFVCGMIIPLFVILLTFNLITADKSAGIQSLYLVQGLSLRELIVAKGLSVFIPVWVFISLYLSVITAVAAWNLHLRFPFSDLTYLWLIYSIYIFLWCFLGVIVSSAVKNSGSSLSMLLIFWILSSVVLPRWAAALSERLYPLPTNYEFRKQIAFGISNGLNGHDVASDRAKRIQDSVLAAEGVDSVQQLRFNFEGYIMERGEEYSSQVYDQQFQKIYQRLERQRKLQSVLSALSPPMIFNRLSQAASNSSLETELAFQKSAETYRRSFVQKMNEDMMYKSSWGDASWETYKVKNKLYGEIKGFEAPVHPLHWRRGFVSAEEQFLMIWVVAILSGVIVISRRVRVK